MRNVLTLLLVLFIAAASLAAATLPDCQTASATVWIGYGPTGCAVGDFTIKNVAWNSINGFLLGTNYLKVDAADVVLAPVHGPNQIGLSFSSSKFSVTGFNGIRAFLDYLIDPPPPILDDFQIEMDANSPEGAGTATIEALVCAGDTINRSCRDGELQQTAVYYFPNGNIDLENKVEFKNSVNIVDVRLEIELKANGSSSQIDGGKQSTALVATPEPGALLLVGSGALLLAGIRRIRKA